MSIYIIINLFTRLFLLAQKRRLQMLSFYSAHLEDRFESLQNRPLFLQVKKRRQQMSSFYWAHLEDLVEFHPLNGLLLLVILSRKRRLQMSSFLLSSPRGYSRVPSSWRCFSFSFQRKDNSKCRLFYWAHHEDKVKSHPLGLLLLLLLSKKRRRQMSSFLLSSPRGYSH